MSKVRTQFYVDGCAYLLEETHDGDVIWVYDSEGNTVASGERDHFTKEFCFDHYDDEGPIESEPVACGFSVGRDLFTKSNLEVAQWLVGTHPGYETN